MLLYNTKYSRGFYFREFGELTKIAKIKPRENKHTANHQLSIESYVKSRQIKTQPNFQKANSPNLAPAKIKCYTVIKSNQITFIQQLSVSRDENTCRTNIKCQGLSALTGISVL
jgi:hypothetical protein